MATERSVLSIGSVGSFASVLSVGSALSVVAVFAFRSWPALAARRRPRP